MTEIHRADRAPHEAFEVVEGVHVVPLPSPTLPPATHTNCIWLGGEEGVVVDPAPLDTAGQEQLVRWLTAGGRRPTAIWLTHHHMDHVGAAAEFSTRWEVPVLAHPATRAAVAGHLATHGDLLDGDRVELGSVSIDVLHTPGHARGHLAFREPKTRTVIAGDLLAGQGTIVIDPPEGDLTDYLRSLARVVEEGVGAAVPAHGPVQWEGEAYVLSYLAHRQRRDEQILDALSTIGPARSLDLVARIYPEVPSFWFPLAARQVLAHLLRLCQLGEVERDDGLDTVPGAPVYMAGGGDPGTPEPRWSRRQS